MEVSALSFSHVPANLAWVPLSEDVGARLWSLGLAKGSLRDPSDGSEVVCVNVLWKGDGIGRPAPKYIKRVAKPGGGYRYYYAAHAGGGVHNTAHFTEGSSFAHGGGHFHVKSVGPDGMLHVEHSQAPGQRVQMTHAELAAKLHEHHAPALESHRKGVLERFMRDIGEAAGKRKESLEKKAAKYGYEKPAAKKEAGAQSKPVLPGKTTSKPYSGGKEYNLGPIGTLDPEKAAKSKAEGKARLAAANMDKPAPARPAAQAEPDYDFSGGAPGDVKKTDPAKAKPATSKIPESRVEHEIPSTNIKRVSWDPEKPGAPKGKMRVHFDGGGVYDYEGVHHDDYRKVIDAHGSHGKAFNEHVKGLHKTTKVRDADGGALGKEAAGRQRDTRAAETKASRQASVENFEARQKRGESEAETPQRAMPKPASRNDALKIPTGEFSEGEKRFREMYGKDPRKALQDFVKRVKAGPWDESGKNALARSFQDAGIGEYLPHLEDAGYANAKRRIGEVNAEHNSKRQREESIAQRRKEITDREAEKSKALGASLNALKQHRETQAEEKKNATHTYGLTRPYGIGSAPSTNVRGEHPDFPHGTVSYPHPLTEEQQRNYGMAKMATAQQLTDMAREIASKFKESRNIGHYMADKEDRTEKIKDFVQNITDRERRNRMTHLTPDDAKRIEDEAEKHFAEMYPTKPSPAKKAIPESVSNPPAPTEPETLRPAEPTRPGPNTDHYARAASVYGLSDKHIQAIKAKSQARAKQATARGDHEGAAKIVREAVRDHVQRSTTHTPAKIAQWMSERESKHVGKSLLWILGSAAKHAPHG